MSYLSSIEISRVQMSSPSDETSFPSSGSKRSTYILFGLKVFELCLIICCIGLIDEPATQSGLPDFLSPRVTSLCYVTFGSLLIYTAIYLIMAMFGDITPWRSASLWSLVGFVLYVATTALLFRDWSTTKDLNYWHPYVHRLDLVLAAACISFIAAVTYLFDILLTICFGVNGEMA